MESTLSRETVRRFLIGYLIIFAAFGLLFGAALPAAPF